MEREELRKGPWTEQEDLQLVFYVNLFGDRRWDFIAKVSGLKRTGKSCRLRWVNYLHPGLKRDKMTPHEERLVLELHSKWGNRWSRIARKIPGRTDNEIKNYWRTHMRKTAQEKKKVKSQSLSSSSSSSSSNSSSSSISDKPNQVTENKQRRISKDFVAAPGSSKNGLEVEESSAVYSMDEIWKDIELSEESSKLASCSPLWDFGATDSLWSMDHEQDQSKMLMMEQMGDDQFHSFPFNNFMTL